MVAVGFRANNRLAYWQMNFVVQESSIETGVALDRLKREISRLYEEHGPALLRYARAVSKSADRRGMLSRKPSCATRLSDRWGR